MSKKIILLGPAFREIQRVCSAAEKAEDGGGLCGFHIARAADLDVVINRFVPGGDQTVREELWFDQDPEHLNAEVAGEHERTGVRFQGNCHVHLGDPRPSWADLLAGKKAQLAGYEVFALVIYSKHSGSEELRGYLLDGDSVLYEPVALHVLEDEDARALSEPIEPLADRVVVLDSVLESIERRRGAGERRGPLHGRWLPEEGLVQVFSLSATSELPSSLVGTWSLEDEEHASAGAVIFSPERNAWSQCTPIGMAPLKPDVVKTDVDTVCARAQGVADLGALREKHVAIVGAGSVGSEIALDLAGVVGRITLVEKSGEKLGVENLCRHVLDLADIGRSKALALAQRLRRANPNLEVAVREFDVREDPDAAVDLLDEVDLVVVTTDVVSRQVLYGDLAAAAGVPALFPWVYEFGDGGEVYLQLPGAKTYREVFRERAASGQEPLSHRPFKYADVANADELRGAPGLRVDIRNVVGTASAMALALLDTNGSGRSELVSREQPLVLLHSGRRPSRLAHLFQRAFERVVVSVPR